MTKYTHARPHITIVTNIPEYTGFSTELDTAESNSLIFRFFKYTTTMSTTTITMRDISSTIIAHMMYTLASLGRELSASGTVVTIGVPLVSGSWCCEVCGRGEVNGIWSMVASLVSPSGCSVGLEVLIVMVDLGRVWSRLAVAGTGTQSGGLSDQNPLARHNLSDAPLRSKPSLHVYLAIELKSVLSQVTSPFTGGGSLPQVTTVAIKHWFISTRLAITYNCCD